MHTVRTQLDYFQRVIPQLWDSFTVYAVDLPGMGWSDIVPGARYEEPELRAAVVEFVTGLDLLDVTLAGRIVGRRTRAVGLCRPEGQGEPGGRVQQLRLSERVGEGELVRPIHHLLRSTPGVGPLFAVMESRPIMKGVMRGGVVDNSTLPDDFIAELRRSGRRRGYSRVSRAIYRSLKGFAEARDRYHDVSVPVTLVYSDQDWSRAAERDRVAALLAEVERITLPDTGHFSAMEKPNEVARILRRSNRP